jgi:hypothetical protein
MTLLVILAFITLEKALEEDVRYKEVFAALADS